MLFLFEYVYKGRISLMKSWRVGYQGVDSDNGEEVGVLGRFPLSLVKICVGWLVKIFCFAIISPGVRVRVNCQFQFSNGVTNTASQNPDRSDLSQW